MFRLPEIINIHDHDKIREKIIKINKLREAYRIKLYRIYNHLGYMLDFSPNDVTLKDYSIIDFNKNLRIDDYPTIQIALHRAREFLIEEKEYYDTVKLLTYY